VKARKVPSRKLILLAGGLAMDFDTFLVTVYSIVDDLCKEYIALYKPKRPGRGPEVSDSEVTTLSLLREWLGPASEREFTSWARSYLAAYFPRILSQSAMNRRVRDLGPLLCALGPLIEERLHRELGVNGVYEALDAVPVPLMCICRGKHHKLFADEASIGQGGSDKAWYYGVRLLLAVSNTGGITGFVVGPARSKEQWLAEAILVWRRDKHMKVPGPEELREYLGESHKKGKPLLAGPGGPVALSTGVGEDKGLPYLADQGFRGQGWNKHWLGDLGATVLTKDIFGGLAKEVKDRLSREFSRLRQVVERAITGLGECFGLRVRRMRTYGGVIARLGAKVAAYNMRLYLNLSLGYPAFSHLNPILNPLG
jgi:hypothetical protein